MKPNTGDADMKTKIRKAEKLMDKGHQVKFTIEIRGRQASLLTRKEIEQKLLDIIKPYKRINVWSKGDNYYALVKKRE